MDKIFIKDLLIRGIVGINDWERDKNQDILVNVELEYSLLRAGTTDNIEDTINYKSLSKHIIEYTESSKHLLVEALAHEIGRLCINAGAKVAKITVEKPTALRFASSVGVTITRNQDDYSV